MYDMAKKAREAMKGKARKLAGEKDQKVDSSDWSPAEALNADVKTGMRPISRRAYKKGGKVEGAACGPTHMGRKARKSGGKVSAKEMAEEKSEAAEYAKAKTNRDVKAANEERPGIKHVGGLKTGGRAKKANGGAPSADHPPPPPRPRETPPAPPRAPENRVGEPGSEPVGYSKEGLKRIEAGRKHGGRSERKDGGKIATSLAGQEKIQKEQAAASKPTRGKAEHYKKGGRAGKMMGGMMPDPRMDIVKKKAMDFGSGAQGSPYKKGGKAKKADGGLLAGLAGGLAPGLAMSALKGKGDEEGKKKGGRVERKAGGRAKGKTNINIVIAAGKPATPDMMQQQAGGPPMPPPGVPVPLPGGPQGGMPMGGAPMPMPMPPAPPQMPMGAPMGRKTGGRVAKFRGGGFGGMGGGMGGGSPFGGNMSGMGSPSRMGGMGGPGGMSGGPGGMGFGGNLPSPANPGGFMDGIPGYTPPIPGGVRGGGITPLPSPANPGGGMVNPVSLPSPANPGGMGLPPELVGRAFKRGGRVAKVAKSYKDMEAGAGSGEGRLQKTDIAKSGKDAPTYKRGGKVYRSYKDMDAGAGSGEGRLEKTEIQSRKR